MAILVATVLGFSIAWIADKKGRNPGRWFVFGLLVWPLALYYVLLVKDLRKTS